MIYVTNPRARQAQKSAGDSVSGWRTCLQLETPSQAGDRRINQDQTGWPGGSGDVRLRLEEYRVPDVHPGPTADELAITLAARWSCMLAIYTMTTFTDRHIFSSRRDIHTNGKHVDSS